MNNDSQAVLSMPLVPLEISMYERQNESNETFSISGLLCTFHPPLPISSRPTSSRWVPPYVCAVVLLKVPSCLTGSFFLAPVAIVLALRGFRPRHCKAP